MAFKTQAPTATLSHALPGRIVHENKGKTLHVLGTAVELKLVGADTANQFALFNITAPPGSHVPTHTHLREDEVFIINEGQVEITINEKTTIADPGTTAFLPRNLPHSWRTLGDTAARFTLLVSPSGFEHYFAAIANTPGQPEPTPEQLVAKSRDFDILFA